MAICRLIVRVVKFRTVSFGARNRAVDATRPRDGLVRSPSQVFSVPPTDPKGASSLTMSWVVVVEIAPVPVISRPYPCHSASVCIELSPNWHRASFTATTSAHLLTAFRTHFTLTTVCFVCLECLRSLPGRAHWPTALRLICLGGAAAQPSIGVVAASL